MVFPLKLCAIYVPTWTFFLNSILLILILKKLKYSNYIEQPLIAFCKNPFLMSYISRFHKILYKKTLIQFVYWDLQNIPIEFPSISFISKSKLLSCTKSGILFWTFIFFQLFLLTRTRNSIFNIFELCVFFFSYFKCNFCSVMFQLFFLLWNQI